MVVTGTGQGVRTVVHVCIVYSVQCREDPVCGRGGGGGERSRGWRAR